MGESAKKIDSTEKVKDVVCGMKTDSPESYISHEYQGETFYFCSKHCLGKFKAEPDKYNAPDIEKAESDEVNQESKFPGTVYTCPCIRRSVNKNLAPVQRRRSHRNHAGSRHAGRRQDRDAYGRQTEID